MGLGRKIDCGGRILILGGILMGIYDFAKSFRERVFDFFFVTPVNADGDIFIETVPWIIACGIVVYYFFGV